MTVHPRRFLKKKGGGWKGEALPSRINCTSSKELFEEKWVWGGEATLSRIHYSSFKEVFEEKGGVWGRAKPPSRNNYSAPTMRDYKEMEGFGGAKPTQQDQLKTLGVIIKKAVVWATPQQD